MATVKSSKPCTSALDVIFTCDICQASISDIYSSAAMTDFQDGRARTSDRRVTCLWLTACMHLTCGKHLEGGGAPFHPKGEHPRAPCPYCSKESNDAQPKALYAVRGLQPGNYDREIPEPLFQAPPVKLHGQGIRMEALKFQYLSLIRYGTSMFSKNRLLEQAAHKVATTAKRVEAENRTLTEQNRELKAKLASLEEAQVEVAKWKERMPRLTHYLKQWPLVIGEVNELRGQLNRLGYAVPQRDYAYNAEAQSNLEQSSIPNVPGHSNRRHPRTARVPTDNTQTEYATGRARHPTSDHHPLPANEIVLQAQTHVSESSSGRKRKLSEYSGPNADPAHDDRLHGEHRVTDCRHVTSETPALPTSEIPDNPGSGAINSDPAQVPQRRTFGRGEWQQTRGANADFPAHEALQHRLRAYDTVPYLMTGAGAQSVERAQQNMAPHQFNSQEGWDCPDSIQRQRYHYKDENMYQTYDKTPSNQKLPKIHQPEIRMALEGQSQSRVSRQPAVWSDDDRGNTLRHINQFLDPEQLAGPQKFTQNPITPLPKRSQQFQNSNIRNQHTSPFFMRVQGGGVQSGLSPSVAGLSANARIGTVSKRAQAPVEITQQDWSQPRSLNSLSFINVPHDRRRNEPLFQKNNASAHRNTNVKGPFVPQTPMRNNQSFTKRPDQSRLSSSYFNSMPPPQNAPAMPRPYQTPRMPPISQFALRPSSDRTFTRDDALNLVNASRGYGAASFYQNQAGSMDIGSLPNPGSMDGRDLFSSAGGRRSVRR